jgi:tetratricopeptide (TPR) repeat protein
VTKGLKGQIESGISFFLSTHHLALSLIHYDSGDLQKALKEIEEALRFSRKNKEKHLEGYSKIWSGKISGKLKTLDRNGEEQILQGVKICNRLKIMPWTAQGYLHLGELYLNQGKKEKALENLKRAEGMFREMDMDYWLSKTQEVLAVL